MDKIAKNSKIVEKYLFKKENCSIIFVGKKNKNNFNIAEKDERNQKRQLVIIDSDLKKNEGIILFAA